MARIGMFCMPLIGHLNPFSTLAHELIGRGHQVTFFNVPDFAEVVRDRGFHFEAFGEKDYPAGTFPERYRQMSRLDGLAASRASLDILTSQAEALFTTARPTIEKAKLDLWIVDHMDYAASTLAACMGAPFVSLIVGLMRHQEDGVPDSAASHARTTRWFWRGIAVLTKRCSPPASLSAISSEPIACRQAWVRSVSRACGRTWRRSRRAGRIRVSAP